MIFTKTSEGFQLSDESSSCWKSQSDIVYFKDLSMQINLSIQHKQKTNVNFIQCCVNSNGESDLKIDEFEVYKELGISKEEYDYFIEYVNFLIDSILEYFKS